MSEYANYIKAEEFKAARKLLNTISSGDIYDLDEFIQVAYDRVGGMFVYKDFEFCKRLAMIGCGPFPMTILHILNKYPGIYIDAIDIDAEALVVAEQVLSKFSCGNNIRFIHSDGMDYHYSEADIIYIANLVRPKGKVLGCIAGSVKKGKLVILRDPTPLGLDKAEEGISSIGDSFTIDALGEASELFASRDVFLRSK